MKKRILIAFILVIIILAVLIAHRAHQEPEGYKVIVDTVTVVEREPLNQ